MLINLLFALLILAATVDFFASRKALKHWENRLTNYWMFVEGLPPSAEFSAHVEATRKLLDRHVFKFIAVVALLLVLTTISTFTVSYLAFSHSSSTFVRTQLFEGGADQFLKTSYREIELKAEAARILPEARTWTDEQMRQKIVECEKAIENSDCQALLARVAEVEARLNRVRVRLSEAMAQRSDDLGRRLVLTRTAAATLQGVVYLLSFIASVFTTLFLLRFMQKARAKSLLLCLLDLMLALLIPVAFITVLSIPIALSLPSLLDTAGLNSVNDQAFDAALVWLDAGIRLIESYLFLFYGAALVLLADSTEIIFSLDGIALWGAEQIEYFGRDLFLFAKGRVDQIAAADAQRLTAIGLSVLFSISYVVFVAFLIVLKRSSAFRYAVARVLQYFIEHPRGPVGAIAVLLAAAMFAADHMSGD